MTNKGFIPAEWVMFELSGITSNIEETKAFIQKSGLDAESDWFAPTDFKRLLANAILTSKDEHYGHSKEGLRLGATALAFRIMNSGSTVLEAQQLLERLSMTFSPNHVTSHFIDGDDVIMVAKVGGFDQEHSAAVELNHLLLTFSAYNAFIGEFSKPMALYSRSKIYTSLVNFNVETNCSVEYAEFSGIRISKKFLQYPRRAAIDRDPLYDAVRWALLTEKMRSVTESTHLPLLAAERMTTQLNEKIKSRNVDVRQKRRIVKADTQHSERELQKSSRTAHAMVLLVTTDKTVAEIAGDLDFSDERSFRRFFVGVTGQTPMQYRAEYRETSAAMGQNHFGTILDDVKGLN